MPWSKLYHIQFQERPISSSKYNSEIDNIYDKLNSLKKSFASSSSPSDFETGQVWFDLVNNLLKIKTSSGILTLAYANNEAMVRSNDTPQFLTLDGSRQMSSSYSPSLSKHVTTKDYVDSLVNSHASNTSNPHQTKESQVVDSSNPIFLTTDGSRQMSSSYSPTLPRDVTTKSYVDNLVTSHTSNTNNPHQTKESHVLDSNNPKFLTLDGTRYMISSYVPTLAKHVTTKDYVDNLVTSHTSNTNNPHQTKESQVLDNSNPVFLKIDGSRRMNPSYIPTHSQDVATKAYVDLMVETGGVGSISSNFVTYERDEPVSTDWNEITNVKEAIDLLAQIVSNIEVPEESFKVALDEYDINPDYLLGKLDDSQFEKSNNKAKIKEALFNKVAIDSDDTSPDYLLNKVSSTYFMKDNNNLLSLNEEVLNKVKVDIDDNSPGYLYSKLDESFFNKTVTKTITLKENSITLNYLNSNTTEAGKFPITNSLGEFYLAKFSSSFFENSSGEITIKDNSLGDNQISSLSWGKVSKTGSSINHLEDVAISSPQQGQVLAYDNGIWKNQTISFEGATIEDVISFSFFFGGV